jgi:hypothetical protein
MIIVVIHGNSTTKRVLEFILTRLVNRYDETEKYLFKITEFNVDISCVPKYVFYMYTFHYFRIVFTHTNIAYI